MTTRTSQLPTFGTVDLPIDLGGDQTVVFRIRPIPAPEWSAIQDRHSIEGSDERWSIRDAAEDLLTEGVTSFYSNKQSTPVDFDREDAKEILATWPPYARDDLVGAVIAATTQGPAANPFSRLNRNGNAAD